MARALQMIRKVNQILLILRAEARIEAIINTFMQASLLNLRDSVISENCPGYLKYLSFHNQINITWQVTLNFTLNINMLNKLITSLWSCKMFAKCNIMH